MHASGSRKPSFRTTIHSPWPCSWTALGLTREEAAFVKLASRPRKVIGWKGSRLFLVHKAVISGVNFTGSPIWEKLLRTRYTYLRSEAELLAVRYFCAERSSFVLMAL